ARGFMGGVAMYPGCKFGMKLRLAKPVLAMIGSDDNWTLAADCEALQAAQPDKSKLDLVVYPGAVHSFDNPVPPRLVFGKYKVGEHPASRDKARARVAEWINAVLKR